MAFNYNLAQTGFPPNPNNRCGGYALDAILFDLNVHNQPQPVNTYNGIQASQNGLAPCSQALVSNPVLIAGGTHISLPSSIAIFTQQLGRAVEVFVNRRQTVANIDFVNVLPEETARINNNNIPFSDFTGGYPTLQDVLQNQNIHYNHFVVLVNKGKHWVAVKREVNGFYMYDPANGAESFFNANGNILLYYNWSGVAIGIG